MGNHAYALWELVMQGSKVLRILNKTVNPETMQPYDIGYQTIGSAGFDIVSTSNYQIPPNGFCHVHTGLWIDQSYHYEPTFIDGTLCLPVIDIRSRSGLARKNKVFVLNSPGTIDMDYKHEIGVFLFNLGKEEFIINIGDRIAQGVHTFVTQIPGVSILDNDRDGGWGSTGV